MFDSTSVKETDSELGVKCLGLCMTKGEETQMVLLSTKYLLAKKCLNTLIFPNHLTKCVTLDFCVNNAR